jgi:hypothetical protein
VGGILDLPLVDIFLVVLGGSLDLLNVGLGGPEDFDFLISGKIRKIIFYFTARKRQMANVKKKVYSYTRKSESDNGSEKLTISDFSISMADGSGRVSTADGYSRTSIADVLLYPSAAPSVSHTSKSGLSTSTITKVARESAVDLSSLEQKCNQLLPYANKDKNILPPKIYAAFMEVVNLGIKVAGTDQYTEFHNITTKVFGSTKNIVKKSVAEQFVGCHGNKSGCDESCAGNFPVKNYTKDNFCETHVAVYNRGSINLHYSPAKPSSVLLIHTSTPVVVDRKSVEYLKSQGISTVRVMKENPDGEKEVKTFSVDNLAVKCDNSTSNKKSNKTKKDSDDSDCNNSSLTMLILFVIFIVIILVIIGMCYYVSGSSANTHTTSYGYKNISTSH